MASNLPASVGAGASPPQSVEAITRSAQDYEYNPHIPLKYWLRTAATLIREARIYEREGHDEQTYLLLFRYARLVLVNLSEHPDSKEEHNRKGLVEAEKEVKISLKKLEELKPRINKRYERYTQLMRDRQSRKLPPATSIAPSIHRQPHDPALAGVAEPLEAGENKDLAVRLARTEISRRATVKKAIRQAGISPEEEHSRRTAGVWGDWENAFDRDERKTDDDLSKRIQEVKVNMDSAQAENYRQQKSTKPTGPQPIVPSSGSAYKYPTVPRQRPLVPATPTVDQCDESYTRSEPPLLPPKEGFESNGLIGLDGPPPRPSKLSPSPAPAVPDKVPTPVNGESSHPDLDPSSFTFKPSAYLENGTPLRTVFLPPDLRSRFLSLASSNTRQNLETCGILCGTLISNALFVSRLLIPEQTSTSDTCETVNESAIFDYCDKEDLMVLGWIHTHPSQTCFMSSRDLHTHCGYQVMLPESIAIVCAPSKTPDWGVFRLTDPPGLKTVLNCTQPGLFHPHAESNVYTDALRPGHVFEAKGLEFETVDQRSKGC
ncbi:hypothetical protein ASPWEDRAFT_29124 [Aspergillus wentii DTO 134E9]|uniref:MPN domain-containing protein n=1 Tax=Aspergillus wentii DTO 134E9 TaxID=1073089 RepID=A0A1L9RGB5_ASPWE|nr:uncharacterized protein ASPWEDRAFT_29124 [Aspergillus wentii DTO 134E9]KAI9927722.1 hypothetical protein MW887_002574 [Aspergillus wentii]OJJ33934.1 hypothetical protein ASPWEDRAFT_29124 [Aspergillus wentii DTO 134E9]